MNRCRSRKNSQPLSVTSADLAAATVDLLLSLFVALMVSAPTYFVLTVGLLLRTLRSPADSISHAPTCSERPAPQLSHASRGGA